MEKKVLIIALSVLILTLCRPNESKAQQIGRSLSAPKSFVMQCYAKKYSMDTIVSIRNYDIIGDYRNCSSCQDEYANRRIADKVYNAYLTNEILPTTISRKVPDYYGYYRGVIRKGYDGNDLITRIGNTLARFW